MVSIEKSYIIDHKEVKSIYYLHTQSALLEVFLTDVLHLLLYTAELEIVLQNLFTTLEKHNFVHKRKSRQLLPLPYRILIFCSLCFEISRPITKQPSYINIHDQALLVATSSLRTTIRKVAG